MKTNEKAAGNQSGFTLIEVMLAILVLAVGLLIIAAGFAQGMRILADAPVILAAKEAAASVADELAVEREVQNKNPVTGQRIKNISGQAYTVNIDVRPGVNGDWDVDLTVPYSGGTRMYSTTTTIRK